MSLEKILKEIYIVIKSEDSLKNFRINIFFYKNLE
uniref:Uncharacterized protein n=1 Tax=viral metagenome TaxID=1070528 RepID=A0A6C0AG96_9ZZZZ